MSSTMLPLLMIDISFRIIVLLLVVIATGLIALAVFYMINKATRKRTINYNLVSVIALLVFIAEGIPIMSPVSENFSACGNTKKNQGCQIMEIKGGPIFQEYEEIIDKFWKDKKPAS
jgi:hypothetical protein